MGAGQPRVGLVEESIDVQAAVREVEGPGRGAVLVFLGNVRDRHAERPVDGITYTGYAEMAERRLRRIVDDLEAESEGLRLALVHRLGDLEVGETSVVIAAASPHREAAYGASRLALERLKAEVPIWKREHYVDGEAVWREEESLVPASGRD